MSLGEALSDAINSFQSLIILPPYIFSNGAVYYGQWNSLSGRREGIGLQLWIDGFRYEGFWEGGRINGRGRMIHPDGDMYEGEWQNGKAFGKGIYISANGATYIGDWVNDK